MLSETRRPAAVSTATLSTCLLRRGLRDTFLENLHRINPQTGPMVGEADLLRSSSAREDIDLFAACGDFAHRADEVAEEAVETIAYGDRVRQQVPVGRALPGTHAEGEESLVEDRAWRSREP